MFATTLQEVEEGHVDPMIRCELMGPAAAASTGLRMTGVYTLSRMETKRVQLEIALELRACRRVALERVPEATNAS